MPDDSQPHHRRSIRLKGYDYSRPGAYFLTLCVQDRELLLDPATVREMVERWWNKLPEKFPDARTDAFVIMPNHIHGVIVIVEPAQLGEHTGPQGEHTGSPLPVIVQWFKTMTTNEYIRGVKNLGWRPFPNRLWQRNYWEHIVRNETDLSRIRKYILENPGRWTEDSLHPAAQAGPEAL